ncbi:calcium/sodium antiporter [Anaerophaga thermohalophila]|uniref:calcium/sodium antiporter n=1 Tax=Anaerophaga thermohalophila TaxID=177400 RepID=UPI00030F5043|nr:calcium/sodium antiporter [Anaerophaga thermohalophila]
MIISVLLLIGGFILLVSGGDWLVSGSSGLARKYRISELAIGLTIVAFGTSAPELVVNVLASVEGHADIAFGNVIGSNNFNLFMILGLSGLLAPIAVQSSTVWKEIPLSLVAAVALLILANDGLFGFTASRLSRVDGLILLALFALFLYYVYRNMKEGNNNLSQEVSPMKTGKAVLLIVAGLAGLIAGGRLVVDSAVNIARFFHISEKVIGLTIIAAGTSMPELVTSLVAVKKKSNDIAVGNVIGSNIFNIFFVAWHQRSDKAYDLQLCFQYRCHNSYCRDYRSFHCHVYRRKKEARPLGSSHFRNIFCELYCLISPLNFYRCLVR